MQERLLDVADSDTKTLSADRIVYPTRGRRTRATWQAGNRLSTGSAGEPWSRARNDTKKGGSGTSRCDSEIVDTFKQVKSHSGMDA